MSTISTLEQVIETMCDKYCKYPEIYKKQYADEEVAGEKMCEQVCMNCPLADL